MVLSEIKLIVYGVILASILAAGGYGYWKWNSMADQIVTLSAENVTLVATVEQQKKDIKDQIDINSSITKQYDSSQRELDKLRKKFNDPSYFGGASVGQAAIKKTKETEEKVNRLTSDLTRCMEIATGSPLTEEEKKNNANIVCSVSVAIK